MTENHWFGMTWNLPYTPPIIPNWCETASSFWGGRPGSCGIPLFYCGIPISASGKKLCTGANARASRTAQQRDKPSLNFQTPCSNLLPQRPNTTTQILHLPSLLEGFSPEIPTLNSLYLCLFSKSLLLLLKIMLKRHENSHSLEGNEPHNWSAHARGLHPSKGLDIQNFHRHSNDSFNTHKFI